MRSKSFATWRAHASLQGSLILDEIGRLPLCQQASGGLTALFGKNDGAGSIAAVLGEHRQQSLKMIPTASLTENKVFMRAKIVGRSGQNTRASPLGKRALPTSASVTALRIEWRARGVSGRGRYRTSRASVLQTGYAGSLMSAAGCPTVCANVTNCPSGRRNVRASLALSRAPRNTVASPSAAQNR
jgi:hypothetical protein